MERAARLIGKLHLADNEKLAQGAWPAAVGRRLAARTGPVFLIGSRLVVMVEDAVWQSQLYSLRHQILRRLEEVLGSPIVDALEFRVSPPRPRACREEHTGSDEADGIADPVLRAIYRTSRKRATG